MPDEPRRTEGVVDAVRDGVATILVGEEETATSVPAARLPDGVGEGSRVLVETAEGEVSEIQLIEADPSTEYLRTRLDSLTRTRPSSRLRRPVADPDPEC